MGILAPFPAFSGFPSADELRGLPSVVGDMLSLLVVVWELDTHQVLAVLVLEPLDNDSGAFLLL